MIETKIKAKLKPFCIQRKRKNCLHYGMRKIVKEMEFEFDFEK